MNAPDTYALDAFASMEAESALIGALLLDNRAFDLISDTLRPEHFSGGLREIYAEIARQLTAGKGCDTLTVHDSMQGQATLVQLVQLAQYVPSAGNIRRYAEIVVERHKSRALLAVSGEIHDLAHDHAQAIDDRVQQAQAQLAKLVSDAPNDEFVSAYDGMLAHTTILEQRQAGTLTAWPTGLDDLDDYLEGGLRPGELVIVGARPSMGKAQPFNAKVLTSDGWAEMGSLKVGDALASVDGQPSIVTGVFPQGEKPVFRVTFTDGRTTECCNEHLWSVNHRKWVAPKVLNTSEIRQLMANPGMDGRLWIDAPSGDFGNTSALPVDPWLLGALLGDGDLTQKTIRFSKNADQILNLVRESLPETVQLVHAGGCDWRLSGEMGREESGTWKLDSNPLTKAMRDLELMGCKSDTKFIPEIYMQANRDARLGVLRGLMDTDGWVEKHGSVLFSSASPQLSKDVQALARSLGYWCSMREKATGYKKDGEYHPCLTAYVLTISGKDTDEMFLFDGKKERCVRKTRVKHVAFASIEASGDAPCQCISVSHPAHLYITDDYVVTHNTALGLTIGVRMAEKHGVALLSMEMSHMEVNDRLTAMLGNVSLSNVKRPQRGDGLDWGRTLEGVERARSLRLYTSDQGGLNINQVRSKARNLKRLHNIDVLIVDYIGLMAGLDARANRNTQLEEISRGLKTLAKELNICVLCLAQLNRKAEERADAMPQMSDLRDSGAIEQDADVILFIKRPIMANPDLGAQWNHYARLSIAKNRQGRCGALDLSYIGEQTRFSGWSGPAPSKSSFPSPGRPSRGMD